MSLPAGKLPPEILAELLKKYTSKNHGVTVGPSIGEDAAAIDIGDKYLLTKTDPITFVAEDIGTYTISINANDIATMGGKPRWFLATILLPVNTTTIDLVENIFQQLSSACRKIDVAFCGGHTEVTIGIDRPLVIGVMIGEVEKNDLITTSGARVGDDIILTKAIAIEGVSIIARERINELNVIFGDEFVEKCRKFNERPGISVLKDAEIAIRNAKVHSMHDPTEGGLSAGLYEIAWAAEVGFEIDEEQIPISEECRILCRHYGIDPLGLIASGSLLITLDTNDTEQVIKSLHNEGITATRIGKIIKKDEGMKSRTGNRIIDMRRFERDEITKILE